MDRVLTQKKMLEIIKSLQDCAKMCEITYMLLFQKEKVEDRIVQLSLLQDCKNICNLCLDFIKRDSRYAKELSFLCSYICLDCYAECSKKPDYQSKVCGQICYECGINSRVFALSVKL
ncbi:hypothetical protein [Metabacillus fastidiosus]|uniref:hypothetical protein n=1 Tax=Metabacillus fastidiosus TaxID=1458 RepID=UPI003D28E636